MSGRKKWFLKYRLQKGIEKCNNGNMFCRWVCFFLSPYGFFPGTGSKHILGILLTFAGFVSCWLVGFYDRNQAAEINLTLFAYNFIFISNVHLFLWDRGTNLIGLKIRFWFYNNIAHINKKFPEVWPNIENLVGISNSTSVFLEDVEIFLLLVHV